MKRMAGALLSIGLLAGCASTHEAGPNQTLAPVATTAEAASTNANTTLTTMAMASTVTVEATTPATGAPITEAPATTAAATTTTEITGVYDPSCVYVIQPGDTINKIVILLNKQLQDKGQEALITKPLLTSINHIDNPDDIQAGGKLDKCLFDGINAITGDPDTPDTTTIASTTTSPAETAPATAPITMPASTETAVPASEAPATEPIATAPAPAETPATTAAPAKLPSGILAQQVRANQLEVPYGMTPLDQDGHSGKFTKQALCIGRMLRGLTASYGNMEPGSAEEQQFMSGDITLPDITPPGEDPAKWDYTKADRWAIPVVTCQAMLVGAKKALKFIFPISTGKQLTETDNGVYAADRYDPADNPDPVKDGWHDSADFPVSPDNELAGNMFEPVYFINQKKAIHGALDVPPEPASHGCVRMIVANQKKFIEWLGLQGLTKETYQKKLINLKVFVIGKWAGTTK